MEASETSSAEHVPVTPPPKRYARIAPLYKAMIWTSFGLNLILLVVVAVLVGIVVTQRTQLGSLVGNVQAFAGNNVAELQDVVDKLETSRIIYTVPLNTQIPIVIDVPIQQESIVTLTEPVPLSVPAAILFPGGGGNLNATVNIQLPTGLELPVKLDLTVPLETAIPVELEVPVNIPLAETELGPQFQRLGAVVERLVTPAEPLLKFPEFPPDSSRQSSSSQPLLIIPDVPTIPPSAGDS